MRNRRKIFNNRRFGLAVFLALIVCFSTIVLDVCTGSSVFATTSKDVVETNFFGNFEDDGSGCGVYTILNLVIDILSMGVAIAGVIGVTIAGIQYMSAKDSEEKTKKAKRRIFEIVIGLVAYAILFVGVQWLLPGGMMNPKCKTITNEQLAQMKEHEKQEEQERLKKEQAEKTNKENEKKVKEQRQKQQQENKAYKNCMKKAAKVVRSKICKLETGAEKISETAKMLAWSASQASNASYKATSNYTKAASQVGTSGLPGNACSGFVKTVLRASGLASDFSSNKGYNTACINDYLKNSPNWKNIKTLKNSTPRPGDIAVFPKPCGCNCDEAQMGHTLVYVKSGGKTVVAEASYHTNPAKRKYGYMTTSKRTYHNSSNFNIYRYVGELTHSLTKVGD